MTTENTGGPAFPSVNHQDIPVNNGMTLRDFFAAKVVGGICASNPSKEWTDERIADEAYRLADAMLEARENKE